MFINLFITTILQHRQNERFLNKFCFDTGDVIH